MKIKKRQTKRTERKDENKENKSIGQQGWELTNEKESEHKVRK